jgi:Domain of unknown function (DUF4468) with TBP-like fold
MVRALLFLLAIFFHISTYAQRFAVTPRGLVNAEDSSRHYVVILADSVPAKDLYARAYAYIQRNLNNADLVNSEKAEGEYLRVKTYDADAIAAKGSLGLKMLLNLGYSLNLNFKNGKVKYEIVDLNINTVAESGLSHPYYIPFTKGMVWCLYNKDGYVPRKGQETKDQLEKYFNDRLSAMITAVKTAPAAVAVPGTPVPKKDDF